MEIWKDTWISLQMAQPPQSEAFDDMVLELAVAAGATHIVTFNLKHLKQASEFGIAVVTPSEFLNLI